MCFTALLTDSVPAADPPPFQTPPLTLKASGVLPEKLLKGPNHRIKEDVQNDGFINIYQLTGTYGPMRIKSTELLVMRINEIQALHHMDELKKTKVFTDAIKEGVKAPFRTVKGMVTEPVDTVSGIATGIGRWFSDIGRSITVDDPHQENVLKTAIGKSAAKRKFAYEYGIDPYTTWPPLQDSLDAVAWTAVSGGLTTKVAFGVIKKPIGQVLRATGTTHQMKQLVRDKSPAELEKINRAKLKIFGLSDHVIDFFLTNPYYNPQETTLLVGALESLKNTKNISIFIEAAARAHSPSIARYMRTQAQMMENYYNNVAPIETFVEYDNIPFIKRQGGIIAGFFALDYVAWTAQLSNKEMVVSLAIEKRGGGAGKELWVEGLVDPVARKALETRGWKVIDRAAKKQQ